MSARAGVSGHEPFLHCEVPRTAVRSILSQERDAVVSRKIFTGRVGEWLKPADCKSAAPCGLRRFESSPVHHLVRNARGEYLRRAAGDELKREPGEIAMFSFLSVAV